MMKTIKQPCSICFIKIKCMKIYTRIRNYKKKGWRNFEIESKELPGKKNLIDRFLEQAHGKRMSILEDRPEKQFQNSAWRDKE